MKFEHSPTQRFYWSEPFRFARARARMRPQHGGLFVVAFIAIAFAAMLVSRSPPETMQSLGVIAAMSITAALLIAYPFMWLASRIPNSVLLDDERIVVGRDALKYWDIEWAIVGTMRVDEVEHPILTFRTRDGRQEFYGLSDKVDSHALADYLARKGVEVR